MDVIARIKDLTTERGWSKYRLSREANLPQTTVANIFNRGSVPSVATLEILCKAFGMSLSEFFTDDVDKICLSSEQERLLSYWSALNSNQRQIITELAKSMQEENEVEA